MPIDKLPERTLQVPYSHYANNMITDIDQWGIIANVAYSGNQELDDNWARFGSDFFANASKGSPLLNFNNDITGWSFQSTGIYEISYSIFFSNVSSGGYIGVRIDINNEYSSVGAATWEVYATDIINNVDDHAISRSLIFKITDINEQRFKFRTESNAAYTVSQIGLDGKNATTSLTCKKIGTI